MRALVERLIGIDEDGNQMLYVEYAGDSTEDKPIGHFVSGSSLLFADNGKVFFYNENSVSDDKWVEQ